MRRTNAWQGATLVCLFSIAVGCSQSLPATVTGALTIGGKPVPPGERVTGNVMFYPQGGGAAAYGQIVEGGKYSLTTGSKLGLAPGKYDVTVRIVDIEPPPPGGYQNAPGSTPLAAPNYAQRDTSGLEATVEPGTNEIDFDLNPP